MLGELDQAEEHLQQAVQIYEVHNLPDVYKIYANLALVARDRGDTAAAARWQAKRDAKVAELERLARGEGEDPKGFPKPLGSELLKPFLALARAAYQARVAGTSLAPDAAEALAHLAEMPPPLGEVASFLQATAGGGPLPPVPPGLPDELAQILQALVAAAG